MFCASSLYCVLHFNSRLNARCIYWYIY
jgi:hypothetical protein